MLPFEIATLEIKRLLYKKWIEKQNYKEFYYSFSGIIRRYIEAIHFIKVTSMTTRQIKNILDRKKIPHHTLYLEIFEYADKVKFSLYIPENKKTHQFITKFKSILEEDKQNHYLNLKEKNVIKHSVNSNDI